MSSSFVVNVRVGLNQYLELARSDPGLGFDSGELGITANLVGQLPNQVFPRINLCQTINAAGGCGRPTIRRLGRTRAAASETTTGLSISANFSWLTGDHTVRGGLDMRQHVARARSTATCSGSTSTAGSRSRRSTPATRSAAMRSRRSCSARRAAAPSTTTSTRRSAGTTTRRGSRTTGRSAIA